MSARVGFIGLGPLGYNIARNLAANASNSVTLWNRTIEKAQQLKEEVKEQNASVNVATSVGQLVAESDVILTCLANDEVVKTVYKEIVQGLNISGGPLGQEKVLVDCSTVYPTTTSQVKELVASSSPNVHFIASPVLGGPPVAAKAQLNILMGGKADQKRVLKELLVPTVGRAVIDCGEDQEKATTAKLIVNSMVIGTVEVLAESLTLAEKSGVGTQTIHQAIKELLPAPVLLSYADKLVNHNFDGSTGFNLTGAIKDASHIRQLSSDHKSPMPVMDIAHEHMVTTNKLPGTSSKDWSVIIAATRTEAGIEGEIV